MTTKIVAWLALVLALAGIAGMIWHGWLPMHLRDPRREPRMEALDPERSLDPTRASVEQNSGLPTVEGLTVIP